MEIRRGRPPKDTDLAQRFSKNLARISKSKFLTQQAIAIEMKIKPQVVSRWFLGVSMPTETNLIQLIKVLGTTREELLK